MNAVKDKQGVLIVDDSPESVEVLVELLRDDYRIRVAGDGESCLKMIRSSDQPAVILLDVMLPGKDGFTVCREATSIAPHIPIIMVTSLEDKQSRIKGIAAGAYDLLCKPVDSVELRLKTRNAINSHSLHKKLRENVLALEELERKRDELVSFLAHDMRTPLTTIAGYMGMFIDRADFDSDCANYAVRINEGIHELARLVDNLHDLTRIESNELSLSVRRFNVVENLRALSEELKRQIADRQLKLQFTLGKGPIYWLGDEQLLHRALFNLLNQAVNKSRSGSNIEVTVQNPTKGNDRIMQIEFDCENDDCSDVADETLSANRFSESTVTATSENTNELNLAFCKSVIEQHGGVFKAIENPDGRRCFEVVIPENIDAGMSESEKAKTYAMN